MTIEEAIAAARTRKLRVANLYEATDGTWRCALYSRRDDPTSKWVIGDGASPAEALRSAIGIKNVVPVDDEIEELLG
jgi:hypothetical protein